MKKYLLLMVSCISAPCARSQVDHDEVKPSGIRQVYASAGLGPSTAGMPAIHLGFSILYRNHWGGSFKLSVLNPEIKNYPPDYHPSNGILGDPYLYNTNLIFSLLLRRQWSTPSRAVKYGIEAGPSLIRIKHYSFTYDSSRASGWFTFGSVYQSSKYFTSQFGLAVRPYIQFPVGRVCGFEVALSGHLTSQYSSCALEFCLDLGVLHQHRLKAR